MRALQLTLLFAASGLAFGQSASLPAAWQPLDNGNWNALSLPFVVGPNGRIARLNPAALPSGKIAP
jgi:hypothetical protein